MIASLLTKAVTNSPQVRLLRPLRYGCARPDHIDRRFHDSFEIIQLKRVDAVIRCRIAEIDSIRHAFLDSNFFTFDHSFRQLLNGPR